MNCATEVILFSPFKMVWFYVSLVWSFWKLSSVPAGPPLHGCVQIWTKEGDDAQCASPAWDVCLPCVSREGMSIAGPWRNFSSSLPWLHLHPLGMPSPVPAAVRLVGVSPGLRMLPMRIADLLVWHACTSFRIWRLVLLAARAALASGPVADIPNLSSLFRPSVHPLHSQRMTFYSILQRKQRLLSNSVLTFHTCLSTYIDTCVTSVLSASEEDVSFFLPGLDICPEHWAPYPSISHQFQELRLLHSPPLFQGLLPCRVWEWQRTR